MRDFERSRDRMLALQAQQNKKLQHERVVYEMIQVTVVFCNERRGGPGGEGDMLAAHVFMEALLDGIEGEEVG